MHVHPNVAFLLQRLASDQIFLVSDALSAYGLEEDLYVWDKKIISVEKGTCRLADGTLAGVALPLFQGVRQLASWCGEPSAAIWAATISPRLALGSIEDLPTFLIGQPLQKLLRWEVNSDNDELIWQRAV